jgi:hypothetical protein
MYLWYIPHANEWREEMAGTRDWIDRRVRVERQREGGKRESRSFVNSPL